MLSTRILLSGFALFVALSLVASAARAQAAGESQAPPLLSLPPVGFAPAPSYEEIISLHIERLAERERALLRAGRPENYGLKLGISIASTAVGGGLLLLGVSSGAYLGAGGESYRATDAVLIGMGAAALLGGVAGIITLKLRSKPHREERAALRAERAHWKRELERLRAQQYGQLSPSRGVELALGPTALTIRGRF